MAPRKLTETRSCELWCEISFKSNCLIGSWVRHYIVYIFILPLNTKLAFLIGTANFIRRFICSFKRTDIDMWIFDDMKMPCINCWGLFVL